MIDQSDILFEVTLINRKKIRLTKTQWQHLSSRHPELSGKADLLKQALLYPNYKLEFSSETIKYYYCLKEFSCYLMVAVRMLIGDGFIVTAYYTQK